MDKFRLKQAQSLLMEAGKSQKNRKEVLEPPHEGNIDSVAIGEIMNTLIDSEEFLYSSRPHHHLLQEDAEVFCNLLLDIRNKIDGLLSEFGVLEKENVEEEIKKLSSNFIFLTSKANFKKLLTKWGVEPQRIVVAGVPLEAEDMKLLNPKIPESALEPIKKKISHVKNDMSRKMDQFATQNVLVVVEDDKTGQLLAKRAEEIYRAKIFKKNNLKELEAFEFKKALDQ